MSRNSYLLESFILGSLIFWGLTCVDINVTVNVTDKPKMTSVENAKANKQLVESENGN